MRNNNYEEIKAINNKSEFEKNKKLNGVLINKRVFNIFLAFIMLTLVNAIILILNFSQKENSHINKNKILNAGSRAYIRPKNLTFDKYSLNIFMKEIEMPHLKEINKKRTFEIRLPLAKEISCNPHFGNGELAAFLSFLTKDTIYFETGSGCSSIIAKYYTKKSYAVEGCKTFYEEGVKHGLKENLIFRNLKPDNPIWSYPGKKSTLDDWKKYFQSYDSKFNADVLLIDGRFKVATAMDVFNKIKDDTIILIHEYRTRPSYFILENYYQYVYHWGGLFAFVKKTNIKEIPLEIQKKYWNEFL